VRGRVEYDDEVIHVIAAHMEDASGELHRLSEQPLAPPLARGDHAGSQGPLLPAEPFEAPPPGNRECGYHGGHPRDVRIIPKSRDFH